MKPEDIVPIGEKEVMVVWEDSHRSLYRWEDLRFLCPCAGCLNEHTGRRTITREKIEKGIKALRFEAVGNYALRFHWNDGHQTGIYSYSFLRKLCRCSQCGI